MRRLKYSEEQIFYTICLTDSSLPLVTGAGGSVSVMLYSVMEKMSISV